MAGPHQPNVCTEAADEIERLRLTDDERMAIWLASDDYLYHQDPGGRAKWIRSSLLGLLDRTNHDAAPTAKATEPESSVPLGSGVASANTTSPPGSSGGKINRSAERQSPASDRVEAKPLDVPQDDNSRAAGGRGHFDTPEAIG